MTVVVGVAGNIHPERHVPWALDALQQRARCIAIAPIYRTAPIGRPEQPDYWNTAIELDASTPQVPFAAMLRELEREAGRIRTADRYAARELDLDVLLWNGAPPDLGTAAELKARPWNQWLLHRLGHHARPSAPEPAVVP